MSADGHPAISPGVQEAEDKLERVRVAQEEYAKFGQQQVDEIFNHVAQEMMRHAMELADMAVTETRIGQVEDKWVKNRYAAEYVWNSYKDLKTVGTIRHDAREGIDEVACPVGPIAAIVPTTNPTSTVIAKALMSLKSGNSVLFLPHPRAKKCCAEAARLVQAAAEDAGAPKGLVECLEHISVEITNYVLKHPTTRFVLATGGPAMVTASYSAGKPALGVGAGNAPVLVDESADLRQAVASIVVGKTFDNGVICASEQSTVVVDERYDEMKRLFEERGVAFLEGEDRDKLASILLRNGGVNPDIVGQSAQKIAKMAGVEVPANAVVLAVEATEIGPGEPLSHEKLSPILSMYRASGFDDALEKCIAIAKHGGEGHTAVMYTDEMSHQDRIRKFEQAMPACHLIVNMPSSAGAIGLAYNFNVSPSLTLGVGSVGGSSTSTNVSPMMLVNIKKLAAMRSHIEWFKMPHVYFNRYCTREALKDLHRPHPDGSVDHKALIVTDKTMVQLGYVDELRQWLGDLGVQTSVFDDVEPDPTITCILKGAKMCEQVQPDAIIALGGGSPMDAAKMMRIFYEQPQTSLKDLNVIFLEIRGRTSAFPDVGKKVKRLICIPTTSGTGSEITPFSVVTDVDGRKYPLCSYRLTPEIAIVDSRYTERLPRSLVAYAGFDTLVHAVESAVSVFASDFTLPLSNRATKLIFESLADSYATGNPEAREKVHHAAAIAGMAFSNAFLGINHAMSHALGAEFHLPHGLANAVLFDVVVRYNSDPSPTRMAAFPQYKYPQSLERYADLGRQVGVPNADLPTMVEGFLEKTTEMRKACNIPLTIKEAGVPQEAFEAKIPALARRAFQDQCVGTNPRFPLIPELEELFRHAYHGTQPTLIQVLGKK